MRLAQRRADDAVHVHGTDFEIRMVAARLHLEAGEVVHVGHGGQRRFFHLLQIALALIARRDARHARNLADELGAALFRFPIGTFAQEHAKATRDTVDGDDVEIGEQRLKVFQQAHLKRRAVVALQSDLVIMYQADTLEFSHDRSFR